MLLKRTNVITALLVWVLLSGDILSEQDSTSPALRHIRRTGSQETAAVIVQGRPLLHTTQLFPLDASGKLVGVNDAVGQIDQLLKNLETLLARFEISTDQVVKLNVYVRDPIVRDSFNARLANWTAKDARPAVAFVATDLPHGAWVALDAIAMSRQTDVRVVRTRVAALNGGERLADAALLPMGDVVYVAGQAERSESLAGATQATLAGLGRTLEHLGLKLSDVVQVKSFLQPMAEAERVEQEVIKFFGDDLAPPVAHVEWTSSLPIEIEIVAFAPRVAAHQSVSYSTPPWITSSPVYSRVARLHGDTRIYVSGLVADKAGDGGEQVRDVFRSLEDILDKAGSSLRHLAKATYYVSADDSSQQLTELRPEFYDPQRPPAASKASVRAIGVPQRTIVLDMIAGPADN